MSSKLCILCGIGLVPPTPQSSADEISEEHIFPKWLQKRHEIQQMQVHLPNGKNQQLGGFRNEAICKKCNTGALNKLEKSARPILEQLDRIDRSVVELNTAERLLIARWALKTAYMLNTKLHGDKIIPQDQIRSIVKSEDSIPDNVYVFAGQAGMLDSSINYPRYRGKGLKINANQGSLRIWPGELWPSENHNALTLHNDRSITNRWWVSNAGIKSVHSGKSIPGSYKIAMQVNKLLLCVCYLPSTEWRYVTQYFAIPSGTRQMHPSVHKCVAIHNLLWPIATPLHWCFGDAGFQMIGAERAFREFYNGLSVMRFPD